jgi:uncharacterized membrane protein
MSASSDKEQSSDDNTEQKTSAEENKQETEQLSKLKRQHDWAAPSLLGCCSLYIAFAAAVVSFGVLAHHGNHETALQIAFFISIPLLAAVPIGVCAWLWVLSKQMRLAGKILSSPRFQAVSHLSDKRAFRLVNFGVAIDTLAYLILDIFPLHPQWAIAQIAFCTMALSVYIAMEIIRPITKAIDALWAQSDRMVDIHKHAMTMISGMGDHQQQTSEHLAQAFKLIGETNGAIVALSGARTATDDASIEAGPDKKAPDDK